MESMDLNEIEINKLGLNRVINYYSMFFKPIVTCSLYEHATLILHNKLPYTRFGRNEYDARNRFGKLVIDLPLYLGLLFSKDPEYFAKLSFDTLHEFLADNKFFRGGLFKFNLHSVLNSIPFLFRIEDVITNRSKHYIDISIDYDNVGYWGERYKWVKNFYNDKDDKYKRSVWRRLNKYVEGYTRGFLSVPYYIFLYGLCHELDPLKDELIYQVFDV